MSLALLKRHMQQSITVIERGEEAKRSNSSLKARHVDRVQSGTRESMSEREFVRSFGDKVKKVRWSQRADFVGLTILGRFQGFTVTSDDSGVRKVRLIDIDGTLVHVTKRYIRVKSHDSISNLQRGLLKYVR